MRKRTSKPVRNLVLVLGDQLDADSAAFDGFDRGADVAWMGEVESEARHVRSHKARIAVFLSAMRHFRDALRRNGIRVEYRSLDDPANGQSLACELASAIQRLTPKAIVVVEPGEYRVRETVRRAARRTGVPIEIRPDRRFLCSRTAFAEFAEGRKQLRMENFYRGMRRKLGIMMEDNSPAGGRWNFDAENRGVFGKGGPDRIAAPRSFPPDRTTREVLKLVRGRFPDHPGSLANFDWPVTPAQARAALGDFITHRLRQFGAYQDAMWQGQPHLFHSRLSCAMNLKLLDPLEIVRAAERACREGPAPLNSVEGFVRQILGWREYVRGVYWQYMPGYARRNHFRARAPLPWFYWTGKTDMACLAEVVGQTLRYGYAHHIQRLMVTGLFALLLGVNPAEIHKWYLAIYTDAVEWVEMPNVLGMSQFADGGLMASKPYAASGKYIQRMSNYCESCRYDPETRAGEAACPFTVLYWDFLARHRKTLATNARMGLQLKNLARLDGETLKRIRRTARRIRDRMGRAS